MSSRTGGRFRSTNRGHRPCVRALDSISFSIEHGDRVALMGHNGAGKTTLLRVLSGTYEPTRGYVQRQGRIASLLNISRGMDQESTGYENIHMRGLYLGLEPRVIRGRVDEIAAFSDLGDYLSMPLYTYSAGMRLRLAFAICTTFDAEILLMDEWLSVGDRAFVDKAKTRLEEFVQRAGIVVLASHNTNLLQRICTKGILLESGKLKAFGPIGDLLQGEGENMPG